VDAPSAGGVLGRLVDAPSRRPRVVAALAALYVVWGSTYLVMRWALEGFAPLWMGAVRFTLAGTVLFTWLRLRGAPWPTRAEWGASAATGFLLLACGNGLVAFAEQTVASSLAAVMVSAMPLWAALFSGLFGQWPGRREWAGMGLGALGVVLLNLEGDLRASVPGAVALVVSPAAWAFGSVWGKRLPLPKGAMASALQMLSAGLMLLCSAPLVHGLPAHAPSTKAWGSLLFLAVFGSLVAYSAYQYLLRTVRPALATSYAYVNPAVALLLGSVLGGERLAPAAWAGAAVVLCAVLLVAWPAPKPAPR
jgi:drug/metabolite transporter (DMT)-like permease